jgi:hypothetical protein
MGNVALGKLGPRLQWCKAVAQLTALIMDNAATLNYRLNLQAPAIFLGWSHDVSSHIHPPMLIRIVLRGAVLDSSKQRTIS